MPNQITRLALHAETIAVPETAIKITHKRLSSPVWHKGLLAWIVKADAVVIEPAVTTFKAGPQACPEVRQDEGQDIDREARPLRPVLRGFRIAKYYEYVEESKP